MLAMLPLEASAQWYLFPGKKKNNKKKADTTVVVKTIDSPIDSVENTVAAEDTSFFDSLFDNFFMDEPEVINVSLALPIKAQSEKPNANFIEMYSGALLAIRDLSEAGIKLKLNVIDTGDPSDGLNQDIIYSSDVIIGPVSYNDILAALPMFPANKYLVSPLEPKAAELVESKNIIQSPAPWYSQLDEMVEWLEEDMSPFDELIVIRDNVNMGEQSTYLFNKLAQKNLRYRILNNVGELSAELESAVGFGRRYKVVIASDNDSFLTGAVRNLAIEAKRFPKNQIEFYCNSRIRSTLGNNVADLYNVSAHITAAYHIDYDAPAVKDFVLAYRALFKGEPGSFAFQGYDAMHYYVKICEMYGRRWHKKLPEYSERGLQSDFRFDISQGEGRINTAVRRVVYNSDFSTTLL